MNNWIQDLLEPIAIAAKGILYVELRSVIGRQLVIKFRGLNGLGTKVINPSPWLTDRHPLDNPNINDL